MTTLLGTKSLTRAAIQRIWDLVSATGSLADRGPVAVSFQGSGTRTRTTFLQALAQLGLSCIELPPFLETEERAQDLAGYLDPFYSLYIIRCRDHARMGSFAAASRRPVINAMSAREHPCEALSDAYWFHTAVKPLGEACIVLWGAHTNVLRSWENIARTWGANVHRAPSDSEGLPERVDLVITDGWPSPATGRKSTLTLNHLAQMGQPLLLPTPPFTIGEELDFDPVSYSNFSGYEQKAYLLTVQKAIIRYAYE